MNCYVEFEKSMFKITCVKRKKEKSITYNYTWEGLKGGPPCTPLLMIFCQVILMQRDLALINSGRIIEIHKLRKIKG